MEALKIIAITHKGFDLDEIGKFHLGDDEKSHRLNGLKRAMNLGELMYLSTCNRVEFTFTSAHTIDPDFLHRFFTAFKAEFTTLELQNAVDNSLVLEGEHAVKHMFKVASSLDSLVVGEREIITQVRRAFEEAKGFALTGDVIRMAVQRTINAAKAVYTQSSIATKPVSVVSLAYHRLRDLNIPFEANILVVGAGKTNTTMLRFLSKHGFKQFAIYNRSLANAKKLASCVNGRAFSLEELVNHREKFDVILTCTSAVHPIFTVENYSKILNGDTSRKVIIDLSVPNDFDPRLKENFNVNLIDVSSLKIIAEKNLKERKKEIKVCEEILSAHLDEYKCAFRIRQVELAMSGVPKAVKEIKEKAYAEVFAKELMEMDENSKLVLDKMVDYLEKKYISVPMKMAKDILVNAK